MKGFFLVCLLFLIKLSAIAQILSPEAFLGQSFENNFAYHHQILAYFEYMAQRNPKNIKHITYGKTSEGRPLMISIISSEKNMQQLESIRLAHLENISTPKSNSLPPIKTPIVWLSYNVHGNEASSSNTSMKMIFELTNSENTTTKNILENTIVIIDPCLNPDGYNRYTNWYNQIHHQTPNLDINSLEHQEPWPSGRFNHYLFDLNRDWAWQTQSETKARIAIYNQWMPHVHADFHEMSYKRSYYFPPAARPYHLSITDWQKDFNIKVGKKCSEAFNKKGWTYFTKTDYDLFYPSYGDTWPTFNGAIGMTFEQAGGGTAGLAITRQSENDTLTLSDRIEHHFTTGMATLETVVENKKALIEGYKNFHKAKDIHATAEFQTFIIKANGSPNHLNEAIDFLNRQDIKWGTIAQSTSIKGTSFSSGKPVHIPIDSNDVLIGVNQPKSKLLKVLLEPNPVLEDSVTYDMTSWGLSFILGLEIIGTKETLDLKAKKSHITKNAIPPTTPYAYLVRWDSFNSAQFLADLLKQGIFVQTSNSNLTLNDINLEKGSLVITRKGNSAKDFEQTIFQIAEKLNIRLYPTSTGLLTGGIDLGHDTILRIPAPKIAVLAGPQVTPTAYGEVWFFLENELKYPFTTLDLKSLKDIKLQNYNTLILPNGTYTFDESEFNKIHEWIQNGGKLIVLENTTKLFSNKSEFGLNKKLSLNEKQASRLNKFENQLREETSNTTPGSMYQVDFDNSHPLSMGCSEHYYALITESYNYEYLSDGWNVGYLGTNNYKAGFVGFKLKEQLKNTLIFGAEDIGKGQVYYLNNNPLFRAMFYKGKILFSNALFR